MINTASSFILYADSEVYYSGRASSFLDRGRYIIIHKSDGSLLIHGSSKTTPINYQGPGAKLEYADNLLISKRKSETIKVIIYNIISYIPLEEWSNLSLKIEKTEKELVQKLYNNWENYFNVKLVNIYLEYKSNLGPIDFLGIDNENTYHVVEVKRKTAVINHCSQLKRYLESLEEQNIKTIGYIASPKISKSALAYLEKHNYKWINLNFS